MPCYPRVVSKVNYVLLFLVVVPVVHLGAVSLFGGGMGVGGPYGLAPRINWSFYFTSHLQLYI